MLHLIKLAVGIRDPAHLAEVQAGRTARDGYIRHTTRQYPKRSQELLEGGSLYWVIGGVVRVRQKLAALEPAVREDGVACTALVLVPGLVRVAARPVRAFQGWRYLRAEDAPADATGGGVEMDLPEALRRELQELALL